MLSQDGNDPLKDGTRCLQTGVCINLDQVGPKFGINHKIHAKKLKIMVLPLGIQERKTSPDNILGDCLHLFQNLRLERIFLIWMSLIQISLKISISHLIAWFIFAIVF